MIGYTFETINKKTGEKYFGKRCAVTFDSKYFGEDDNEDLAIAIEKYGRPSFESHMIMPYETPEALDVAFEELKPTKVEEIKVEEPREPVVEKKPAKKGRKKVTEEK